MHPARCHAKSVSEAKFYGKCGPCRNRTSGLLSIVCQWNEEDEETNGGESGIRTHVRVSPKHAFQACAFNHSAISPAGSLPFECSTLGGFTGCCAGGQEFLGCASSRIGSAPSKLGPPRAPVLKREIVYFASLH